MRPRRACSPEPGGPVQVRGDTNRSHHLPVLRPAPRGSLPTRGPSQAETHSKAQSQVGGRTGPSQQPPMPANCPTLGLARGRHLGAPWKRPHPSFNQQTFNGCLGTQTPSGHSGGPAASRGHLRNNRTPLHCKEDVVVSPRQGQGPTPHPAQDGWTEGHAQPFPRVILAGAREPRKGRDPARATQGGPPTWSCQAWAFSAGSLGALSPAWSVLQPWLRLAQVSRPCVPPAGCLCQACAHVSLRWPECAVCPWGLYV